MAKAMSVVGQVALDFVGDQYPGLATSLLFALKASSVLYCRSEEVRGGYDNNNHTLLSLD